ncbi:MAG TPA: NAD(P)H-binding protein [Pseudonocardia sp.]
MTTLVIGARGAVGRHVLDQLLTAGEPVRASVRRRATAAFPEQVSVVEADLTRPDTLKAAVHGVQKVFLYAQPGSAADFADAACAAGVEHVVLMSSGSVLLPYAADNAITVEHREVEEALTASGLNVTPIRPLVLANNALNWADSIRADGVVSLVHPGALMAPIHERDIAAVAVAALTGTAGDKASDLLTGGELLSQRQQVELIGQAIDTTIRVEALSMQQARARFAEFESPEVVEAILAFIVAAAEGGSPATTTAQEILGHAPASFAQWADEHADDFR